jgi:hypothetical protein
MRAIDFASLSPEERVRAVASLLAVGVRRLRPRVTDGRLSAALENPPKSVADCLELSAETRLTIHTS